MSEDKKKVRIGQKIMDDCNSTISIYGFVQLISKLDEE